MANSLLEGSLLIRALDLVNESLRNAFLLDLDRAIWILADGSIIILLRLIDFVSAASAVELVDWGSV